MNQPIPTEAELAEVAGVTARIRGAVASALSGLDPAITTALAVVLAEGHLLMEDVPGVGKTTLARALARSVDCTVGRIQFTPDLLPSDVTGVSIFRAGESDFEFRPGPVFSNVVIADEINRASPKTQSALLEAMQERAVTSDGVTRPLPTPFLVVATQNPVEMEGTYPLPEAQRDRFMAQIAVGYPAASDEMAMLDTHDGVDPLRSIAPVTDAATLGRLIAIARRVFAAPAIKQYIVDLVGATRAEPGLRLGASPRASLHLLAASKARAAMAGAEPRPSGRHQGARGNRARPPSHPQHRGAPRGPDGDAAGRRDRPARSHPHGGSRRRSREVPRPGRARRCGPGMTPTPSPDASSTARVTARGVGLAVAGIAIAALGVGLASPVLVYVGVTAVCVAAVSALWMLLAVHTFLLRFPLARREVAPRPLTVGTPGRVTVTISSAHSLDPRGGLHPGRRLSRSIVEGLDIREQAAAELTGGAGTKASVARLPDSITLSYALAPTRRGRWPLGPAIVHSSDPFGLVLADTSVGGAEMIPVWPAIIDLTATAGALMGHADRVVIGARTPSPDDASLRDYREGDDLRRVHWKSSARHGEMLVRSDERAGRRPATVLIDLPRASEPLEWAISAAASIALSVLASGHPVRLLGGGLEPSREDHSHSRSVARAHLLNQTLDLRSPVSDAAADVDLARAASEAAASAQSGDVTVGVFEPLSKDALRSLVAIGDHGRAWAIVRAGSEPSERDAADATVTTLRRAGWRAMASGLTDDLSRTWTSLLTAGDLE